MVIVLGVLLVLWLVLVLQRTLFWVWLWQLKEYRLDRLFAEFPGRALFGLIFGWPERAKFLILVVGLFAALVSRGLMSMLGVAVALYALLTLWAGYGLRRGRLRRPVFTPKAMLVVTAVLASNLGVMLWAVDGAPTASRAETPLSVVIALDLFLPFLVFLTVLILKVPTALARAVLSRRAARWRQGLPNLLVIGITGSFGKTSTKEFLAAILGKRFRVVKTPEHLNSEIALARFVLDEVNETHEILVAELGAYKQGEIRRLATMLKPQIGILTGISEQHLALFGSLEKTKQAKYELIEALPPGGLAIFNADTAGSHELYGLCDRPKKLYSTTSPADCYAEGVRLESLPPEEGEWMALVFQVKTDGESRTFKAPLFGSHHAPNVLAATTAALSLGMTLDEIRDRAQYLRAPAHTMTVGRDTRGRVTIDDTYSANPNGVSAALESLAAFPGAKVLVMPSLIELGAAATRVHEEIGRKIAEVCALAIITTRDGFAAIEQGVGSVEKTMVEQNPQKILATLERETKAGDVILLESRVPEKIRTTLLAASSS